MASTMPPDESGAARACWVKNVMLHFVDGGQSVFHGYPMAYRFFEQADGGWSRWYGNEIFLKSLDTSDWQSLPKPPPLWLPGQAVKEGAVRRGRVRACLLEALSLPFPVGVSSCR